MRYFQRTFLSPFSQHTPNRRSRCAAESQAGCELAPGQGQKGQVQSKGAASKSHLHSLPALCVP